MDEPTKYFNTPITSTVSYQVVADGIGVYHAKPLPLEYNPLRDCKRCHGKGKIKDTIAPKHYQKLRFAAPRFLPCPSCAQKHEGGIDRPYLR